MAIHNRQIKANGTAAWINDEIISHSEHNDEWDQFLSDYNGNITDANIASAAAIDPGKLDDHADNAATYRTTRATGDHFSLSLPTDMEEELENIRYRINANTTGSNMTVRAAGGSMESLSWVEPPMIGRNLLKNPGFELQSGGAGTAPDGWTLVGSPSTISLLAGTIDSAGVEKRMLRVIGNGVGIQQQVTGLKDATKYRFGVAYERTSGTIALTTTGSGGTSVDYGDYGESDTTSSAGVLTIKNGVIKTAGGSGAVTVNLTTTGSASAQGQFYYVWLYELSEDAPVEMPAIPSQTASISSAVTYTVTGGVPASTAVTWNQITGLDLTVRAPGPGYRIVTHALIPFSKVFGAPPTWRTNVLFRMKIDGTVVVGPVSFGIGMMEDATPFSGPFPTFETAVLYNVFDDVVPGTDHDITFEVGAWYDDPIIAPEADESTVAAIKTQTVATASARLEKI